MDALFLMNSVYTGEDLEGAYCMGVDGTLFVKADGTLFVKTDGTLFVKADGTLFVKTDNLHCRARMKQANFS